MRIFYNIVIHKKISLAFTIPICANVVKHETYHHRCVNDRFIQHPRNSVENLHRARVWRNSWFRMSSGMHIRKLHFKIIFANEQLNSVVYSIIFKLLKENFCRWILFRVVFGNFQHPFPSRGREWISYHSTTYS